MKALVAEWSYLFAHGMPFVRGSAAVREWMETALYHYHGFEVECDSTKTIDLEALTAVSYEKYLRSYQAAVCLRSRELA